MNNFVLITFSDIDYMLQVKAAAEHLSRSPCARVSKDSVVAAMLAEDLLLMVANEKYIDANLIPRNISNQVKHLLSCLQVSEHKNLPAPTHHDVQVVIDLHTKHVHHQTWS